MKTLIIPPAETKLSFAICACLPAPGALNMITRKDTAAEAIAHARSMAAANCDVRVMQEIAFTVDPGAAVHHGTADGSPVARPDARDVLIRRLVNLVNKAGMEVLEERMPSLIEIADALTEAKSLGYVPTGSKAEPIKYPDTVTGRALKQAHEAERERMRLLHEQERKTAEGMR